MPYSNLKSISPLDGRYSEKVSELRDIFSEYGLIKYRVFIEIKWLQHLSSINDLKELPEFNSDLDKKLNSILNSFGIDQANEIKKIESVTNHDVKAIEYYLRDSLKDYDGIEGFIHFGCTSEDINNLSYALMFREARENILLPMMKDIKTALTDITDKYSDTPMISRTHGQTASPTTVGKEMANIIHRLNAAVTDLNEIIILGKFNGAVGNFNAHYSAYPELDWIEISNNFIKSIGLTPNELTTQIEPHDWTAKFCHCLIRYNVILLDLCKDIWGYISIGYFKQKLNKNEVGSSTMPHKVNPIDFENAEGNLGVANSMLSHFSEKLPISRFQRDLTDSTVQRNFGVAIGYTIISMKSLLKGLKKLELDEDKINDDLLNSWEVISEAIQTVMRRYNIPEPYEKLKELTRGQKINNEILIEFIESLEIPDTAKKELISISPSSYIGAASILAKKI